MSSDDSAGDGERVRPYILTGGRTRSRDPLPIEALVTAGPGAPPPHLSGVHHSIVELCQAPRSLAEVSARLSVPLGVTRVLVDDLVEARAVAVHKSAAQGAGGFDLALLERVRAGLLRL